MAQPSQEFPPWLSPSVVIITNAAGEPVATETSIVYIPPTYFGPSIPLGSLYIFGGSTEPATVVLPSPTPQTTTTVAPPVTTTATPPTTTITTNATPTTSVLTSSSTAISSTSPTTSATPTSSSASSTSPSTVSLSTSSISSTHSYLNINHSTDFFCFIDILIFRSSPVGGLTKGQLVGVIVASILGLIFLFVLALFLFLWCKGRRSRRNFNTLSQGIDDDYYFVPPGGRIPGEGSPRHSGEEADPFLQRSSEAGWAGETSAAGRASTSGGAAAAAAAATGAAAMTQVASQAASRPAAVTRVPPPITGSNSSNSTNSHASGFGVLLDRPSLGLLPITPEHQQQQQGGTRLSAADMERIGHESVLPDDDVDQYPDEEYTGAYAYARDPHIAPRLVGPASASAPLLGTDRSPFASPSPLAHQSSFPGDAEESATLLTARRVNVGDLGPRSPPAAGPSQGGLLGTLGLGGLGNIRRMSWFRSLESPRQSMFEPSYVADPLSEKDLETGRTMLSPSDASNVDSFGGRTRGVGLSPDGSRPKSGVSARSAASGGSVYHDAQSSIPGTPVLAPLPRAVAPADNAHSQPPTEHAWFSGPLAGGGMPSTSSPPPPAYSDHPPTAEPTTSSTPPPRSPTGTSFDHTPGADILDMPAPTALNHFSSISSLKETNTGSSVGPIGWSDVGANVSPVASFGLDVGMGMGAGMADAENNNTGISIDVLEEAPPDAEQGWRTISSAAGFVDPGRRGTFGTFVQGPAIMSEQGSLHSMRSHFSPSSRSTGSAPASRRDLGGSMGSNASSRPSMHSSIASGFSAAAHSLVRAGSISSDERRRNATSSPALSAFGHQVRAASQQGHPEPSFSPVIGEPPSVHVSPDKANTLRSMGSGSAALMDTSFETVRGVQTSRSISPLSASFPLNAPWVGGLDNDWQPSA
ncbi:hypothetical protein BDZ97DRAFT_1920059 [Flammula alnicola]|nr:hypothetical protein BDZ97DRAFT_1920059 [Flammula alnicola]